MAKKPTEEEVGTFEVEAVDVIKKGTGKRGPWKLYEIEFDEGEVARGFDKVSEGDEVDVFEETTFDEDGDPEYTNTKYRTKKKKSSSKRASKKSDDDDEPKAKSSGGGDKRVVKLLAMIAAEVGIDEEEINAVLEEK